MRKPSPSEIPPTGRWLVRAMRIVSLQNTPAFRPTRRSAFSSRSQLVAETIQDSFHRREFRT